MNWKKTIAVCFGIAFLFIFHSPVSADQMGSPTPLSPNTNYSNYTFNSPRTVANGYWLSSGYLLPVEGDVWVSQDTGVVFTNSPATQSLNEDQNNYSKVYANPSTLEVKAVSHSQTDGSRNYHTGGTSQAWDWFILTGNPGQVALVADILVQGEAYANNGSGGNAASIFTLRLGFLSNPEDLVQDYVMRLDGTVGWEEEGFGSKNTVDEDVIWEKGDTLHQLNYLIRSQAFTVTVGVPFRLSLIMHTETFAGPGDWGEAFANFYDPNLQCFYVDLGSGQYTTLSDSGYSMTRIPEPATLLLLGLGLVGLEGIRRRTKK